MPLSRLDGCLRMVTGAINMASNVGQCHLLGSWTRVAPVTIFCLLTQPADLLSAAGASFEERGDTFLPPCFLSFIHGRGQNEARLPGSTARQWNIHFFPTVRNLYALHAMGYLPLRNVAAICLQCVQCVQCVQWVQCACNVCNNMLAMCNVCIIMEYPHCVLHFMRR